MARPMQPELLSLADEFIDHLYTPLGTTSNYSALGNLHTLQIIIEPANLFCSLLWLHQPFPCNGF
jgi:hypothetical protein